MNTIGSRIALYRNSRRWTQNRLASELGIAQGFLSDMENDKVSPKWDMINKIAERLEVPLLQLLPLNTGIIQNLSNGSVPVLQNGDLITVHNDPGERELWKALLEAKDETIEALKKQLEAR